jgi:hypothetical protein
MVVYNAGNLNRRQQLHEKTHRFKITNRLINSQIHGGSDCYGKQLHHLLLDYFFSNQCGGLREDLGTTTFQSIRNGPSFLNRAGSFNGSGNLFANLQEFYFLKAQ